MSAPAPRRRWLACALAGLALVAARPVAAADAEAEAGAFAALDVGARVLGMGGAGTVFERSAWATYWNAANLFRLEGTELAVDTTDLFGLGIARHTQIAFAWRTDPKRNVVRGNRIVEVSRGTGQLGWGISLGVTSVDLQPEAYTEISPGLSVAGQPWNGIAVGGTFRFLAATSDLDDVSARGVALDLGLHFDRLPAFEAAATARNLLSTLAWSDDTSDQLPLSLTLGLGYAGLPPVKVAGEATFATDTPLRDLRFGAEWSHSRGYLQLRGGAIVHQDRLDDRLGLTFGAGTGIGGVAVDYAFVGHNETLDDTHRLSLSLRF